MFLYHGDSCAVARVYGADCIGAQARNGLRGFLNCDELVLHELGLDEAEEVSVGSDESSSSNDSVKKRAFER